MTEKTINIMICEAREKLTNTVNELNIPITIIDMLVAELYNEVHSLAIQQCNKELKEYNQEESAEQQ